MEPALSSSAVPPEKAETTIASVPDAGTTGKTTSRKPARKRIPRLKAWTPVIVTWVDAVTTYDPVHSTDNFAMPIRRSIGHFLKRTRDSISIAMEDDREHKNSDSDCQTVTSIPIALVRKVVVLAPKE